MFSDFQDSYRNLTYKSLTMMFYVTKHLQSSANIIKVDDDNLVNSIQVKEYFKGGKIGRDEIACKMLENSRVERNESHKW